ncbi:MAG: peptidoglycan-associated lipoprotein Pal [Pseudomonadota bacterium]
MKNLLLKLGAVASVSLIAACGSTGTEVIETDTSLTTDANAGSSIQPGSIEDFQQTATNRVFFAFDQYNLTATARDTLRQQAAWLNQYPEVAIEIAGNCDERGTREYNLALGARRANAAKDFLVGLGVDPSRITTISYGKDRPIDPRSTEEAWALNRNSTTTITSLGS